MTERELTDIEAGLERWSVCSPETARKLIAEVRRLHASIDRVWLILDDAQNIIEGGKGAGR